jgi:hypothetical protein
VVINRFIGVHRLQKVLYRLRPLAKASFVAEHCEESLKQWNGWMMYFFRQMFLCFFGEGFAPGARVLGI